MSRHSHTISFIKGVFWGSAIGVGAGVLLAPVSGERTLAMLRERTDDLAEQARRAAERAQARAEALQARSRELIADNVARVTRTAEAVRRSAAESWNLPEEYKPEASTPVSIYSQRVGELGP